MSARCSSARMKGEPVDAPYTLDDMARDGIGLLDALGIAKAHIVGASMGGMIAQVFAANHPDRTLSLVSIMSTSGRPGLPPAKPEAMGALLLDAARAGSRQHHRARHQEPRHRRQPQIPRGRSRAAPAGRRRL